MGMDAGIPSGKADSAPVCTADDYHMVDGEYKWNPKKVGFAHKLCQEKCEKAMIANEPRIIVANTSTTEKEMQPYIDMAEKYDYMVISLIVENRHGGKNSHGVPEETLEKMENRFSIKLR